MQNGGSFSYALFSFIFAVPRLQMLKQSFKYTAAVDFVEVSASEKVYKLKYEEKTKKKNLEISGFL